MMEFKQLKYIYIPAENPEAHTLLLLHGTGGNETDLIPIAKDISNDFNILSVRGNVSENGMPRFFKRLGMGVFDEKDLHFRTDELVASVKDIAAKEGFDSSRIIALGFSNGANIAGAALLKYPHFFAGAILLRPMQPFKEIESYNTANNTPVFFSSGKTDPTVNPEDTDNYVTTLKRMGHQVTFYSFNTGHNLVKEDIEQAAQWLRVNFG